MNRLCEWSRIERYMFVIGIGICMSDNHLTANALWIAFSEDIVVSSITTDGTKVMTGVRLDEYESDGPIRWFRGKDSASVPVQIGVKYHSTDTDEIATVTVYRGAMGVEYGEVTDIVVG